MNPNASQPGGQSLQRRIEACYARLPGSEQRVANLLLDFPGHLATHSATEIAVLAKTSKAAVSRLVQRLGYDSFATARSEVRSCQQWGSPLYLTSDQTSHDGHPTLLEKQLVNDTENLRRTFEAISPQTIIEIVTALAKAHRVLVVGHRNSATLAQYLRAQLGILRANVDLAPMPSESMAEGLHELGQEDFVIAIGLRRRIASFAKALKIANRRGARVLLLTEPSGIGLAGDATWTLVCHTQGVSMFDSYVSVTSLANLLVSQLAHQLPDKARGRLRAVEAIHEELGDLA